MTTTARERSAVLAGLLERERSSLSDFLVALADFDEKKLWLELDYGTLFDYLHRDLGLSKAASFYRMTAARLVQRHPEIVEPLRDGRLCFSSVVQLSKVLTAENLPEVLPRYFHLSKREAKEVTAGLQPTSVIPMRQVVTKVPSASAAARLSLTTWAVPVESTSPPVPEEAAGAPASQVAPVDPPQASVHPGEPTPTPVGGARAAAQPPVTEEPLTAELTRLHITVPRRLLRKLEQAREVLSHSHPGASADEIIEAGLDLLIERHAKRRGLVKRPREASSRGSGPRRPLAAECAKPPAGSMTAPPSEAPRRAQPFPQSEPAPRRRRERIPASILREVWKRDGGKCQWKLPNGEICGSTHRVQIDHHGKPWAKGGGSTAEELQCLCDVHNDLAARRSFGDAWMDRYTRRGRMRATDGRAGPDAATDRRRWRPGARRT